VKKGLSSQALVLAPKAMAHANCLTRRSSRPDSSYALVDTLRYPR